ncbi:hypothetical protein [Arcticibacterium luteifluviistationis]|uniref:DUF2490 domain-containing protein n=1 Tax=Arcticibacterium luteifluviistationis TaxID=1784714 RepID=A0A2Z4GHS7_9BACT|nr:hypothetical protein [Arcticibacterium luteifluviistationis]AWW00555.1 hypothetical protein DJ013_21155 [Arcticibacterium luteifluviistationis]
MKILKIISLLVLASFTAFAQQESSLSLDLGVNKGYFKDNVFSPVNYRSSGTAFGVEYRKVKQNNDIFLAKFSGAISTLNSDFSSYFITDDYQVNLELGYLKNVRNKALSVNVGGQLHSYINADLFDGTEAITFFSNHSLEAAAILNYTFKTKHSFESKLSIPLVAYMVRPQYSGWDKYISDNSDKAAKIILYDRGKFTSLNDFKAINWQAKYSYQLGPKMAVGLSYQFRYYSTEIPGKTTIANNHLNFTTNFKL